jgi:phosphosulfolactate phosphohydrolase-like enzyme
MKLTRRAIVPKKLRKQTRRSAAQRQAAKPNGFELNVSPEEIMSDLNFGVGSLWETAQITQEQGVRAGGPHESN